MYGKDIERILSVINQIKDETSIQIEELARVSDYRIDTIKHTHNVHVVNSTGSDGENNGSNEVPKTSMTASPHPDTPPGHEHQIPEHKHKIDCKLTGNSPTDGKGKTNQVSDQLTYSEDYSKDEHSSHEHTESGTIYEKEHPEDASSFTTSIVELGDTLQEDITKLEEIEADMYKPIEEFNNQYGSPWKEIYILKEKIDNMKTYAEEFPNLQWIGEKHSLLNLMRIVVPFAVDAKWALIHYHDWIQRAYDNKFNENKPSIAWNDFVHGKTIGNIHQDNEGNVRIEDKTNDPF